MLVGPQEGENLLYPLVDNDWVPVLSLRHWIIDALNVLVLFFGFRWLPAG